MKALKIGQLVRVTAVAALEYQEDNRKIVTTVATDPFLAVVTGQAIKHTGRFLGRNFPDHNGEYGYRHLKVDGAVTLWEVRHGMVNKPLHVRDEDLEAVEEEFTLPRCARRIVKHFVPWTPASRPPTGPPLLLTYTPMLGSAG